MARLIDANALFTVVKEHHDLYKGATNPADKARRDECLQVMCDINDAPTVNAIPVEWIINKQKCAIENDSLDVGIAELLEMWQKEQEAR